MITPKDRRFRDYWLEQSSGPKWKYYLQFSIAWMIVTFLSLFFLSKLFTNLWETGGSSFIYIVLILSAIIGFVFTHLTYTINQKRLKRIDKDNKQPN
jgi:pilus assembly protein TadC